MSNCPSLVVEAMETDHITLNDKRTKNRAARNISIKK
jgi:hypothetical protein